MKLRFHSKNTFWSDYRVGPPNKGRICPPCAEQAAIPNLGSYEAATREAVHA